MMERYEEMNRMREHVMKEVDRNRDSLITMEEFIESTNNEEFNKDPGWKVCGEAPPISVNKSLPFDKCNNACALLYYFPKITWRPIV